MLKVVTNDSGCPGWKERTSLPVGHGPSRATDKYGFTCNK